MILFCLPTNVSVDPIVIIKRKLCVQNILRFSDILVRNKRLSAAIVVA